MTEMEDTTELGWGAEHAIDDVGWTADGTMKLDLDALSRLQQHLAEVRFPVMSPAVSAKPLDFLDKFRKVRTVYELSHVDCPEESFFLGKQDKR